MRESEKGTRANGENKGDFQGPSLMQLHGAPVIPKHSGSVRICVDLKHLNQSVLHEVHHIPDVDETLAQMAGLKLLSKMDTNGGLWLIDQSLLSKWLASITRTDVSHMSNILSSICRNHRRKKVYLVRVWTDHSSFYETGDCRQAPHGLSRHYYNMCQEWARISVWWPELLTTTWRIGKGLSRVCQNSETKSSALKQITHKLAVLPALTTASRSSDLSLLTVTGCNFVQEGVRGTLSGLSKQSRPQHSKPAIEVPQTT